jgi:hypothetical protein
MRRNPLALGLGTLVLLGLGGPLLYFWLSTPAPGVTLENFHRLHLCMSANQVEEILGKPAEVFNSRGDCTRSWRGEEWSIDLGFEEYDRGLVGGVAYRAGVPDQKEYLEGPTGILDHVRRLVYR